MYVQECVCSGRQGHNVDSVDREGWVGPAFLETCHPMYSDVATCVRHTPDQSYQNHTKQLVQGTYPLFPLYYSQDLFRDYLDLPHFLRSFKTCPLRANQDILRGFLYLVSSAILSIDYHILDGLIFKYAPYLRPFFQTTAWNIYKCKTLLRPEICETQFINTLKTWVDIMWVGTWDIYTLAIYWVKNNHSR